MKKIIALALALTLTAIPLAACTSNLDKSPSSSPASTPSSAPASSKEPEATTPTTPSATEGGLKTGFAVVSTVGDSKDAGDKDGLAKADSTMIAVLVDSTGKIVNCVIDGVQTSINFSKEGKLVTDIKTEFKTKKELGADYGMAKASTIGKEWNEQVDAFAKHVTGKTLEEVKGIAINEKTAPTDAELAASVTISVGGYIAAIEKAVNSAKDLGAKEGDKLGIAAVTNIKDSKDVGEKDGLGQAYSTYTAASFGADGKVTSCIIDGSQSNVNFDKTGKITTDLKAELKTKNELGADYGMAKASAIGKEWNEQAEAYAKYVVGKSVDEIKGIAVSEKGAPSDAELAASVTVGIANFTAIMEKAAATAK